MTRRGFLGTAAAVSFLGGCVSGQTHTAEAEEAFPPVGDFLTANGVRMHYVDVGEGPPIVLIHGANGNVRDWTFSMVDRLKADFRVIAIDRPGHGYSDRAPQDGANPEVQAALIAAAADQLGVSKAIIVGHSWGGAVATAWGLARPEQVAGMAVLAGATYPWNGDGGTLYSLGAGPLGGAVSALARSYVRGDRAKNLVADVFAPNEMTPGYAEHIGVPLALRPRTFRYNADDIDQLNGNLARMAPRYGALAMPMEVIHGDADETVFDDVHSIPLWRTAQNANLTILPGVGHMPHHSREDEVVEAIYRLRAAAFG